MKYTKQSNSVIASVHVFCSEASPRHNISHVVNHKIKASLPRNKNI